MGTAGSRTALAREGSRVLASYRTADTSTPPETSRRLVDVARGNIEAPSRPGRRMRVRPCFGLSTAKPGRRRETRGVATAAIRDAGTLELREGVAPIPASVTPRTKRAPRRLERQRRRALGSPPSAARRRARSSSKMLAPARTRSSRGGGIDSAAAPWSSLRGALRRRARYGAGGAAARRRSRLTETRAFVMRRRRLARPPPRIWFGGRSPCARRMREAPTCARSACASAVGAASPAPPRLEAGRRAFFVGVRAAPPRHLLHGALAVGASRLVGAGGGRAYCFSLPPSAAPPPSAAGLDLASGFHRRSSSYTPLITVLARVPSDPGSSRRRRCSLGSSRARGSAKAPAAKGISSRRVDDAKAISRRDVAISDHS